MQQLYKIEVVKFIYATEQEANLHAQKMYSAGYGVKNVYHVAYGYEIEYFKNIR